MSSGGDERGAPVAFLRVHTRVMLEEQLGNLHVAGSSSEVEAGGAHTAALWRSSTDIRTVLQEVLHQVVVA
jgi:hypothetical protein